jgi:phosphohistidine swiveling domain-containing protein
MFDVVSLAAARDPVRFGEKSAALARLCAARGVRVPPGFAVSATVFRAFIERALPASQWPETLLAGPPSERSEPRLARIRATLAVAPLPSGPWRAVCRAWRALGAPVVAVRSSATMEDTTHASGAGVFTSSLGALDEATLERAVREVYARVFDERALGHLARLAPRSPPSVALLVQRLVRATAAGVLFTEDPIRREPGVMRVESALGLGPLVVDGAASPDVFLLSRETGAVLDRSLARKTERLQAAVGGGVERVAIAPPSDAASLDDEQLADLASAARSALRTLDGPRDIEFAFEGRTLWIVQARPIVRGLAPEDERARWVWSNVNVGEALPGVATPLTWSIAAAFSDEGFRKAFGALGCSVPEGVELVGRFHGRIYLNLTHFLAIAAQVPALDPRLLLELGGGSGADALLDAPAHGSWSRFALRAPWILARYAAENASLDARLARFEREADQLRARMSALDLRALGSAALADELERLEAALDRTGTLMLTCASGALSGVLATRALLRATAGERAARLEQTLLTGRGELPSARPGIALAHLALELEHDPDARAMIEGSSPDALSIEALPLGPTRRGLERFLIAYGYRATREAELSTPRWREDPSPLFATLRAQRGHAARSALTRIDAQALRRGQDEASWIAELPRALVPLARRLLARARRFLTLRERMRAHVTEILGYFRSVALEASRRIARSDPSVGTDAAFFLTLGELSAALRGSAEEPGATIRTRRAEYLRDASRPDPPSHFIGAPPTARVGPSAIAAEVSDRWQGIAASPGQVRGIVRILRDPREGVALEAGEVLVVPVADVGWTPLFLTAAGIVTGLGGALSHASLVAREYGVPAVVNVPDALSALRDGDLVDLDGDRGIVTRLSTAGSHRDDPR